MQTRARASGCATVSRPPLARCARRRLLDGRRLSRARRLARAIDRSDNQSVHGRLPGDGGAFQAFIDARGYTERWGSLWSSIGWSWKQRYNSGAGLDRPPGWESVLEPVRISNNPVKVTWYEAAAFARWLEHLRRAGSLRLPADAPDDHVIWLPDEAERELAARYPDGRAYPWGDRYYSGFANIQETAHDDRVGPYYLGRITAVGIYPLGRQPELDLYDLSGNDSEWCLTCWDEAGYSGDNDPEAGCHRVSRGGHYHNGTRYARAASRTWGDPDPDDQYDPGRGFRLVIGTPF